MPLSNARSFPARFVRASSDVPSISARDDSFSIYHAYGGNGRVAGVGDNAEISVKSATGSSKTTFLVKSGRFCFCGYEIDVEEQEVPLSGPALYLRIDLLTETAEFVSVHDADTRNRLTKYGEPWLYGEDPFIYASAVFYAELAVRNTPSVGNTSVDVLSLRSVAPLLYPFEQRVQNLTLDKYPKTDLIPDNDLAILVEAYAECCGDAVFGYIECSGSPENPLPYGVSFSFPEDTNELLPASARRVSGFVVPWGGDGMNGRMLDFTVDPEKGKIVSGSIGHSTISNGCTVRLSFWYKKPDFA